MVSDKSAHRRLATCIVTCYLISPVMIIARAEAQDAIKLDPVVVQGKNTSKGEGLGGGLQSEGYVAKETSIATKTDTDIRRVPQSVGTVSRKELEDRNVQSLVEAARYTAGVRVGQFGFDPRFDTIFMRGFNVTDTGFYRDGLRSLGGPFSVFRHEPYTLQGVTFLKGPSSGVYGSGAPGGIVNVISKRPTEEPFHEIETQFGSHHRAQLNVDTSGPVGGNDNFLYRLTGVWRSADTQFIAARDDKISIAPAFTFRSDDRKTQLTVLGEYTDFTSGGAAGWYTRPPGIITDYEQGDRRYKDYDGRQYRIGYEFEHEINDNLAFKQNLRYQNINTDMRYVGIALILGDTIIRAPERLRDEARGVVVDNQLIWNFATGGLDHKLITGLDYSYVDYRWRYGRGSLMFEQIGDPLAFGDMPLEPPTALDLFDQRTKQRQTGLYVQDQIDYNQWSFTVGGRYDWLDTKTIDMLESTETSRRQNDSKLTGRVGLSYLFENGISPYASYSTSFAPTIGVSAEGNTLKPTEGKQMELGIRYTPEELNMSVSAAVFDIKQSNMLIRRGNSSIFQDQTGEVSSRGFEIQATSSITDSLSINAAYTYLRMKYHEGEFAGNFPAGIPDQQFSIWSQYNVLSGPLDGVGAGAGIRFLNSSYANDANTMRNPSRTLVDASLSYDFGKLKPKLEGLSAQVSAKNILDNRAVTCTNLNCYREEGRSIIGSLKFRF
ncbi:TonB-dependent siderophore receptor [Brucella pseudogrignonensis]|uniref:Heme transporter BhuA n=1 Tax=Brucella pseudogrignonensis TaxID=419475 RepID=A0ABU1MFD1_9HYPH|nr:TonB-dependent siderophore receptor [Brucella pseudogrignonensis]MDR6434754.1 iron complex outermembrane receptor protein [Brucella pseudogrignonensis]